MRHTGLIEASSKERGLASKARESNSEELVIVKTRITWKKMGGDLESEKEEREKHVRGVSE